MLLKSNKAQTHHSSVNIVGDMDMNDDSLLMTHKIHQNMKLEFYIFLYMFSNVFLPVILHYWIYGQIATQLKAFPSKVVF